MATYREVLNQAQQKMIEKGYGEQSSFLYMVELTNKQSHNLYMEMDEQMDENLLQKYEEGICRMLQGEPLGHVLGYEWFYGYSFKVNSDVLIPRPETEELVANILAEYDARFAHKEQVVAVDVGTGSGAIAIAIKKEANEILMLATDISEEAIKVASENAKDNEASISFLVGNMLDPLIDRNIQVDILISNPPYIPVNEEMEDSVVNYEPHVALFGGKDGLKFYREIFSKCRQVVNENGMMAFEMGWNQKEAMTQLLKEYLPECKYEFVKDMSGKDRMLFVYL